MKLLLILTLTFWSYVAGIATAALPQDKISNLQTLLNTRGLSALKDEVHRHKIAAPLISSLWHVQNRLPEDKRPAALESRDFGRAIVEQLAKLAPELTAAKADNDLYTKAAMLLDLGDWFAATEGYGNLLIARRCQDLAAVALARLTTDLNYPLDKCEALIKRFDVHWMKIQVYARVLNQEAGASIFPTTIKDRDELEYYYGSGRWLQAAEKDPDLKRQRLMNPLARFADTPEIMQNLAFFVTSEGPSEHSPQTLLTQWDERLFPQFIAGLELQSVSKVKALAVFRRKVGDFPEKEVRNSPYKGTKSAFREAWRPYPVRETNMTPEEWNAEYNLWAGALQAWTEVKSNSFLDEDTGAEKEYNESNLKKRN